MTIKFLHTADWHLGRVFFQMSLLEEQRHALKQIIAIAVEQQVQAVLIAGDVFDRSIAPVEAVQLLDEIVTSLICEHAQVGLSQNVQGWWLCTKSGYLQLAPRRPYPTSERGRQEEVGLASDQ